MPRRTWLDSKIDVFLEELAASGMHLDRQRAGELITGQVRTVAILLRVTEATARTYLGDEIIKDMARRMLFEVAGGNPIIPTIPVAFTTFAVGQALYTQARQSTPPVMSLSIPAIVKPNTPDYNVIAESKGGDPNHVVVVDAHLDAIYGAGMLDNASGSATILDVAQQMKNVNPLNKLRFIWFGGEEVGPARLLVLRQQPELERPEPHRLRPRRGRDGDAQLHHRRPRPGRAGPVQRHRLEHVPQPGLQGLDGRA